MADTGVFGFFCPHCRKEIKYDMSYYNRTIAELKSEISKINCELENYKSSGIKDEEWKQRAVRAQSIKIKQLQELKAYRHSANEALKNLEMKIFWRLVKEKIGEDRWEELHKMAEKELEYSSATDSMKKLYTRADGHIISKV